MTGAHSFDLKRLCVAALLCLALLPRLIIPSGYMPSVSAQGIRLVMCGGVAPVMLALPTDPHKSNPSHDHGTPPCGFAATTTQAALDAPPVMVDLSKPAPVAQPLSRKLADLTPQRLAAPPPPSHAPPALA